MEKMIFNQDKMKNYLSDFDVLNHKFFYTSEAGEKVDPLIREKLIKNFYPREEGRWNMEQAVETFLTMDKVYHYGNARDTENTNILELVTGKFLREYVNIEGMEELFQSSYFYFEWMMHLEYKEEQHDYSYYRDHYLHQVRNLYEMFVLLDQEELWRTCMNLYREGNSRVAAEMKKIVREQKEKMTPQKEGCLRELKQKFSTKRKGESVKWTFDEFCYHYIIFATAAVSSLVHDIGYPVVYMRRNMDRIQGFLPMSHIFMDMGNCMPHIKSLLSNSLLFSTVGGEEIQKRLGNNDHGAYSAIILLTQYYDNGRIFSLDPIKRMVVELSALVIYNHTLKYEFQDKSKYDRCHSVFVDNPISWLFRLCDDLQEWERVYFLISNRSAFFVCDRCKTPMIRRRNQTQKYFSYSCMCDTKGWNSLWFPYRRMVNVAPFTELEILCPEKPKDGKKGKWILDLKCDRKALLQLTRYNDTFALQRLRGVRELREMVKKQEGLPDIYVRAFLTNNPVAVKVKILEEFAEASGMEDNMQELAGALQPSIKYLYDEEGFFERLTVFNDLDWYVTEGNYAKRLYKIFREKIVKEKKYADDKGDEESMQWILRGETEKLMLQSLKFYLHILILGRVACKKKLYLKADSREEYEKELSIYCEQLAKATAHIWNVTDTNMIALLTDCFVLMHCDLYSQKSFWKDDTFRYKINYPLRLDICDVVQSYTEEEDYLSICKEKSRERDTGEIIFDFYSDYFLFFMMDDCTEKNS